MSVGRNDPCPCGSGKKYKKCCLPRHSSATSGPASELTAAQLLTSARSALQAGDLPMARHFVQRALKASPKQAAAWALACGVEMQEKNFAEAKRFITRALEFEPDNPFFLYNYGTVLAQTGEQKDAVGIFKRALSLKPDFYQVYANLGNTLRDLGRAEEAVQCYLEAFRDEPRNLSMLSNILLSMHHFSLRDHGALFEMHTNLGRRLTALTPADSPRRKSVSRRANGKVRVGYVSPRFSREIVGYFFKPIFDQHDRDRFELFLYSATERTDDLTNHFAERADKWTDVTRLSDSALCQLIVTDEIDILIDLAGHAPESRISAIARKPAPVQVSMLDYFDTTGLEAMDYYVTDAFSTPAGGKQKFVEELVFLDRPRLVYEPPAYAPEVRVREADGYAGIVFGSFNRHPKIIPRVVELWSRLLHEVPESRLVLKSQAFSHPAIQNVYRCRFTDCGVEADRIEFRGKSLHEELLAQYSDVDIALDTFPYNGGLTTCEALWMGTPVIALEGERIISRQSAGMLRAVGLSEFVASDEDQFVAIGKHWAEKRDQLNNLRRKLRGMMAESPLTDGAAYTRELEQKLSEIWERFLAAQQSPA